MKRLKGIGHDLSKLVMEIQRRGLAGDVCSLDFSIVRMMNPAYKDRRYSYRKGGHDYGLVLPTLPAQVAEKISKSAFRSCERLSENENGQKR